MLRIVLNVAVSNIDMLGNTDLAYAIDTRDSSVATLALHASMLSSVHLVHL